MDFIVNTLGVLIPIVAIWTDFKNKQLEHNLKLKALEKGMELPAAPLNLTPIPTVLG